MVMIMIMMMMLICVRWRLNIENQLLEQCAAQGAGEELGGIFGRGMLELGGGEENIPEHFAPSGSFPNINTISSRHRKIHQVHKCSSLSIPSFPASKLQEAELCREREIYSEERRGAEERVIEDSGLLRYIKWNHCWRDITEGQQETLKKISRRPCWLWIGCMSEIGYYSRGGGGGGEGVLVVSSVERGWEGEQVKEGGGEGWEWKVEEKWEARLWEENVLVRGREKPDGRQKREVRSTFFHFSEESSRTPRSLFLLVSNFFLFLEFPDLISAGKHWTT